MSTIYVGMDIHKNFIQGAAVDEHGNVLVNEKFSADDAALGSFMRSFAGNDVKAAIEATCTWYHVYDALQELGIETTLVNTRRTKTIAESKIKTDSLDARTLAQCLRTGFIAVSWVPPKETRELRNLVRHRISMRMDITCCKNRMQAILLRNGIKHEYGDVFGKAGTEFLHRLALSETEKLRMESYLLQLEFLEEEKAKITDRIENACANNEQATLLTSMPGISYYSALAIVSEIGDITRFPTAKKLCSYAGLVPSTRQSGDHVFHGRTMKECNHNLKWILGQCTVVHVTRCKHSRITRLYYRVAKRHGNSKAMVAASHKMLRCIWHMCMKHEQFRP
jgi:transposase